MIGFRQGQMLQALLVKFLNRSELKLINLECTNLRTKVERRGEGDWELSLRSSSLLPPDTTYHISVSCHKCSRPAAMIELALSDLKSSSSVARPCCRVTAYSFWFGSSYASMKKAWLRNSKLRLPSPELSMGRLDQARTRKCKPEPGPNPKIIQSCKWAQKTRTIVCKLTLNLIKNFVQFYFHKPYFTVYSCAKPS